MEKIVDWNEPPLVKWLGTTTKKGTIHVYRTAYMAYAQYTRLSATQLIDEAIEDSRKDVREKKDLVKSRIIGFHNWLLNEYPKQNGRKGLASKTANTWANAVRSFYGTYELFVKLRGRSVLPKPRAINKRGKLESSDIKRLVDFARSPRDRAIILTMFQSGLDVSTLCSLKYGDVRKGLEKNEHPLKLVAFREKAGVEYYTFLGRDAINAIQAYLSDAKARGVEFSDDTPLFIKEVRKEGIQAIETNLIQKAMREIAESSGIVRKKNDWNPINPHTLRESFSKIMANKGVDSKVVDFWLGHSIGELSEVYQSKEYETLRQIYLEHEVFISISMPNNDNHAAVEELRKENMELKSQVQNLREKIGEIEVGVAEIRKALQPS